MSFIQSPSAAESLKPTNSLTADPEGLTAYQTGPQIWIRWNNRLLTCYRAHNSQKLPYMYPLAGPISGLSLTSETALPYPHHSSLFFGCDRVNGCNFWQEGFDHGQIVSQGPALGKITRNSVEILDACLWKKPGMNPVMKDKRRILVTVVSPQLRFIDWDIEWSAVENVVIQKTNHSLFAARAAIDIVPTGGGVLRNAEGLIGEKATFGKPSAWCDFSGKRADIGSNIVEGIAIMENPKNPWPSCPWFTRDYGFMSPTAFNFMEKSCELAAGKSVNLRYRVALHAGNAQDARLDFLFNDWVKER
jgi:hypothetical protein